MRDPLGHARAELIRHQRRVVSEAVRGLARAPAANVLERLRQVPVVERGYRLDPPLEQSRHEPAVEVDAAPVGLPVAARQDARPRDREAVGLHPERLHQVEVGAPAVVVVARNVAVVAAVHGPGHVGEAVPDRLAPAVLTHRSFDLVGGRGHAEAEAWREAVRARTHPFSAPAVMPRTSQPCTAKNAIITGTVATTPAAISWS